MLIQNAEIFAAGQWPGQGANGLTFSESDLDGIVSSFNSLGLKGRVPLKLGHDGADARTSDSAPALGWVEAVRRDGNKLLADIKLTSEKLAEGIRAGAYKFVSVELLRNVQAHTRQIPWVLDAVALLGATAPAVGTLKDLQTSMQSFRRTRSPLRGERLAFKREDVNQSNGDSNSMDEAAVQALVAKSVSEATAKFSSQVNELTTKLAAADAETKKARASSHRFAVLAPIENAIAAGKINAAAREKFVKMNRVNDDVLVLDATPAMAEEWVKECEGTKQFAAPPSAKRIAKGEADDEHALAQMSTAQVLTFRTEQRVIKLGQDVRDFDALQSATQYVLKTDAHLAAQYFADHAAKYELPSSQEA